MLVFGDGQKQGVELFGTGFVAIPDGQVVARADGQGAGVSAARAGRVPGLEGFESGGRCQSKAARAAVGSWRR